MDRTTLKEIVVNTGEVKYSRYPVIFSSTGVGSCVVVFIYDVKRKIGGVAHIMLPILTQFSNENVGLFANTSTSLLISKLVDCGAETSTLKAKIIGGANIFDWAEGCEFSGLGKRNIENVKRELLRQKVYLAAEEVGGTAGKTVKCCTNTGQVLIKSEKFKETII
jgi:chemotaxis protein CheD